MIRVLHVIGPMTVGGAQTQLLGLLRSAHGRLWDATVCATSPGPMVDDFRAAGIPVVVLRRRGSPGLGRLLRLRRLVGRGRYDVVHANLWQANAYARVAVAGRRSRPRVVISERNVESLRARWKLLVDRLLAHWTDIWVANSEAVCDFTAAVHPVDRTQVVHVANAVDREVFTPPAGRPHGPPWRLVAVGRLDPEKGVEDLIAATAALVAAGRDVRVRVVGTGPLERDLRERARGLPVELSGPVANGAAMREVLAGSHLLVHPARFREGRPNVILEALATHTPVVATDLDGNQEAARGAATLATAGDPSALAGAIADTLDDLTGAGRRVADAAVGLRSFADLATDYGRLFGVRFR